MMIREIKAEDTWAIRQQVMWPDQPIAYVKVAEDQQGRHWGLYAQEELVSVISCFETPGALQFRKFATLASAQGNGYGTQLMLHVLALAEKQSIKRVWCNARADKSPFYEKFGLKQIGEGFSRGGIRFVQMERVFE